MSVVLNYLDTLCLRDLSHCDSTLRAVSKASYSAILDASELCIDLGAHFSYDQAAAKAYCSKTGHFEKIKLIDVTVPAAWAVPGVSYSGNAGHYMDQTYVDGDEEDEGLGKWWASYTPSVLETFLSKFENAATLRVTLAVPPGFLEAPRQHPVNLFSPPEWVEHLDVRVMETPDAPAVPDEFVHADRDEPKVLYGDTTRENNYRWGSRSEADADDENIPARESWRDWWMSARGVDLGAKVWLSLGGMYNMFDISWPNLKTLTLDDVWVYCAVPLLDEVYEHPYPSLERVAVTGARGGVYGGNEDEHACMVLFPCDMDCGDVPVVNDEVFDSSWWAAWEMFDMERKATLRMAWPPLPHLLGDLSSVGYPEDQYDVVLKLVPGVEDWKLDVVEEFGEGVKLDVSRLTEEERARVRQSTTLQFLP